MDQNDPTLGKKLIIDLAREKSIHPHERSLFDTKTAPVNRARPFGPAGYAFMPPN